MAVSNPIYDLIPHRPPFLWIDRIVSQEEETLTAEKHIPADLELFQGHYPEHPIVPGVLLCEALFQTGALLIAANLRKSGTNVEQGVPVITRINKAKFKREVGPGDTITMQVKFVEQVGPAWFLKGKVMNNGKVAAALEFACTLKKQAQESTG